MRLSQLNLRPGRTQLLLLLVSAFTTVESAKVGNKLKPRPQAPGNWLAEESNFPVLVRDEPSDSGITDITRLEWTVGNLTFEAVLQESTCEPLRRDTSLGPYIFLNGSTTTNATDFDISVDLYDLKHQSESPIHDTFGHMMVNANATTKEIADFFDSATIHDKLQTLLSSQQIGDQVGEEIVAEFAEYLLSVDVRVDYTLTLIPQIDFPGAPGYLTAHVVNTIGTESSATQGEAERATAVLVTAFVISAIQWASNRYQSWAHRPSRVGFLNESQVQAFLMLMGVAREFLGKVRDLPDVDPTVAFFSRLLVYDADEYQQHLVDWHEINSASRLNLFPEISAGTPADENNHGSGVASC